MAIKKLSMAQRTEAPANPVVNAVDDEALREEVALIVAATGRDCVQETVPPVAAAPVAAQALTSSPASPPANQPPVGAAPTADTPLPATPKPTTKTPPPWLCSSNGPPAPNL